MSDDGERNCPLCAEEMDLTDQQLKPCRCGYEICVWCWHHIIEMAEKDDSEARCPACRTAYDKERIVGTAAKCERVVAEVNAERKQKPKARVKASSDARKHLNSVRVIQRNLVYVIGLPTNMADESLLERREYFGQYGRVMKVSISRTSGGSQQASNINTFNVYITYAKEEEAVRCIQAVHNFVLEGKTLRACFGTTKYCRAWLRNMACNNPDCLYLHDVGCQEDSFTKDEVISAYTRNRVPQAGLASGSAQRRIGSVLPPPADELSSSMAVANSKIVIKASNAKSSPLDIGGSGKPAGLPAAASWGLRTNLRESSAQGIAKDKSEALLSSSVPPSGASMSSWHDNALPAVAGIIKETQSQSQKIHVNGRCKDSHVPATMDISDGHCSSAWSDDDVAPPSSPDKLSAIQLIGGSDSLPEMSPSKGSSSWYDDVSAPRDTSEEGHADISKVFIGNHSHTVDGSLPNEKSSWDDDIGSTAMLASDENRASIRPYDFSSSKAHSSILVERKDGDKEGLLTSPYSRSDCLNQAVSSSRAVGSCSDLNGNIQNLSSQLSILTMDSQDSVSNVLGDFRRSSEDWQQLCSENGVGNLNPREYSGARILSDSSNNRLAGTKANEDSRTLGLGLIKKTTHQSNAPKAVENFVEYPRYSGRLHTTPAGENANLDRGESNIISNILSMDFDPWGDASVSTGSFAKFLDESDERNGGLKMTTLWKGQSNNESRFSFARQESQQSFQRTSFCEISQVPGNSSSGIQNGFVSSSSRYPGPFNGMQLAILAEKSAAAPRAKTTAPPGFSSPSRFQAPPPGFSSHEKLDQVYDISYSDNHIFGGSSLIKEHQISSSGYNEDVEFFDPAILAVGKGRVQHGIDYSAVDLRYPSDVDSRLQLLMQQSFSHQEPRVSDTYGSRFLPVNNSYVSSRHLHQNLPAMSPFGMMTSHQQPRNSHWESNMEPGMSETLRNKALGLDRFLSESEETFRSGLNRDFGI